MGKERRPQRRADQRETVDRSADREGNASQSDQELMGNQAIAARLGSGDAQVSNWSTARDAARDLVGHANLALEVHPRGPDQLGRFVEILENSLLPADQKQALVARLTDDEAVARDISDAVTACFGRDDDGTRDAASDVLQAVDSALRDSTPTAEGIRLDDGNEITISTSSGRALSLITETAAVVLEQTPGTTASGSRILAFCQRSHLALMFEEEEEELAPEYGVDQATGAG